MAVSIRIATSALVAISTFLRIVSASSVVAHFMVQNTPSFTQADWVQEISVAKSIGIEGFALNIASFSDYEPGQVSNAYAAAQAAGNFSLFFSFDMGYTWDPSQIVSLVSSYASSSATYRWNGAVLVSTFNGADSGSDWWQGIKSTLSNQGIKISFAPAFINYRDPNQASTLYQTFPGVDGFFNWWSWPNDVNTTLTTDTDIAYKNALKNAGRSGPYMMAVSPWQYKDFPNGQAWVEQCDTLWKYRWEQAINDVKPDIVQIISWNDYGESHYISDINPKTDLQLAVNWVQGIDHSAWRDVAEHYITWYKTGSAPAITEDKVIFWYRIHPRAVTCSGGDIVRMSTFPADAVFALSMLTSTANITVKHGSNTATFTGNAGITIGQVAFSSQDNQTPSVTIGRNGQTVISAAGPKPITSSCPWYNFNPVVGKATSSSSSPPPSSSSGQLVVAHFMVQNTPNFTQADWAQEILSAKSIGVDGFALNIASFTDYEPGQVNNAYAAAQAAGNFYLFFSFDMGYSWDPSQIVSLISAHASSSATYRWNGAVLMSTFNGADKGPDWWQAIKNTLSSQGITVSFVPAFINYRDPNQAANMYQAYPALDGFFNWWSWPNDVNTTLTTDTDIAYKNALKNAGRSGPYMMAVSPWQYKDFPNGQAWVEQCDTLWKYRWEQAINDVKPDIVQIISWNDYGESHYISDINPKTDLQLAVNWVQGIDHSAWRDVAKHYITWYKTGNAPPITEDKVIFWYRVHPRAVTCTGGDTVRMSTFPADAVFALSMLASPANITVKHGSNTATFTGNAGITIGQVPFSSQDNQTPSVTLSRNGQTVASATGPEPVTSSCAWYNFNPVVGKAMTS